MAGWSPGRRLAAYQAREVEPIALTWGDWTVHTAPLTAGGATIIESMRLLQDLKWADREPGAADTTQFQVEAFRYAWQDRLELLGDPQQADVPLERLLDRRRFDRQRVRLKKRWRRSSRCQCASLRGPIKGRSA